MGSGFSKMKKQARMLEEQVEKIKMQMQSTEITASSAGGLVTVVINGEKELKKITIKPECVDKNDLEGLQDLILLRHGIRLTQKLDEEARLQCRCPPASTSPF